MLSGPCAGDPRLTETKLWSGGFGWRWSGSGRFVGSGRVMDSPRADIKAVGPMKKASLSPHQLFFSLGQPNSRNYLPFLLFPSLLFPSLIPNIVLKSIQISKNYYYYYYFKEYLIREVTILEHINLVITFIKPLRRRAISIKLKRSLWNIPVFFFFFIF